MPALGGPRPRSSCDHLEDDLGGVDAGGSQLARDILGLGLACGHSVKSLNDPPLSVARAALVRTHLPTSSRSTRGESTSNLTGRRW
jgi:hypothetical protein